MNYEQTIRQLRERRDFYAAAVTALEKIQTHENGSKPAVMDVAQPKRSRRSHAVEDVDARRARLLNVIAQRGPILPNQMTRELGYTARQKRNIHNDLIAMEKSGQVTRVDSGYRSNVPDQRVETAHGANGGVVDSIQ